MSPYCSIWLNEQYSHFSQGMINCTYILVKQCCIFFLSPNHNRNPLEIHWWTIFLESQQFCNKQNNNINMIKVSMAQWPLSHLACCWYAAEVVHNSLKNNLTYPATEGQGRTTTGHHRNPSTFNKSQQKSTSQTIFLTTENPLEIHWRWSH